MHNTPVMLSCIYFLFYVIGSLSCRYIGRTTHVVACTVLTHYLAPIARKE